MKISKTTLARIAVSTGVLAATFVPMAASAFNFEDVGQTLNLGTADLKETVINVLNLVLGLLALIAVIMVIIGGFTWMTAGGNEEKVDKAKKIISSAVVGMIIVLLSWAIVIFFADTARNVSGA